MTRFTARNGAAVLSARAAGEGPTLVLLPGMGRPAEDLDPFAALLRAAGYRTVQPDPRGLGESRGPLAPLTLRDFAADVAAVIDADGVVPACIVGHAFGNRIARCLATDRPDLAPAVALLSCSGRVQPSQEIAEAIRLAQAPDTTRAVREAAVRAAWYAPGADISVWMDGWSQELLAASLAAAAATPVAHWWTAGRARLLIAQGLSDVSAPVANGRLIRQEVGDRGTLVELPGVGHAMAVENPRAVADAVITWLREGRDG